MKSVTIGSIEKEISKISNNNIRKKIHSELSLLFGDIGGYGSEVSENDIKDTKIIERLKLTLSISKSNPEVLVLLGTVVRFLEETSHPENSMLKKAYEKIKDGNADTSNKSSREIVKPTPISGFLEFTPEIQLHLDGLLFEVRKLFSSHGYVPLDTPVVERLEVLAAKGGDVDKEIYSLNRARAKNDDISDAGVALRYDLTVPFARYVARHFNELIFPFKRFHIGSCFRGERPQDGRYRQFTQADIDIVNPEQLPLSFDADIPLIVNEAIKLMGVSNYVFGISNRKLLSGYLQGLGVEDLQAAMRILDKIDKVGCDEVVNFLVDGANLKHTVAERAVKIATICTTDTSFISQVKDLGISHALLDEGLSELEYVMERLNNAGKGGEFHADLSITRGFDYYTGTVYEVRWNDHPNIGSIAAGGRYADLAGSYIRKNLPGIGMSVGISRIYGKLVQTGAIKPERKTSTDVLVAWEANCCEDVMRNIAEKLRVRGMNVEVYFTQEKIPKQVSYADKKDIPYVVFPEIGEVKDMRNGEQFAFNEDTFVAKR